MRPSEKSSATGFLSHGIEFPDDASEPAVDAALFLQQQQKGDMSEEHSVSRCVEMLLNQPTDHVVLM